MQHPARRSPMLTPLISALLFASACAVNPSHAAEPATAPAPATAASVPLSGTAAAPQLAADPANGRHDIGGGTLIVVPKDWVFRAYPMPAELHASNIRIVAPGLRIAITGFLGVGPMKSVEALTTLLETATKPFVAGSVEKEYRPITADNISSHVVLAPFTAVDKAVGFRVMQNERSLAAASAVVSKETATYSISISMNKDDAEGQANFKAAIEAVKAIL